MKAVLQICDDNDLDKDSVKYAPLSMIETLQEAAYQQMQAETSQMTASSQLPEAQEQALDEYPMPDEQVSTPDMQEYGYSYDGMLPVTRERALELDAAGLTVYVPVSYTHLDVYKRQIRAKEGMGGLVLEGTEAKILSDVVAQFYAYLSGCMFNDPVGMAIYAELHYICLLYTSWKRSSATS